MLILISIQDHTMSSNKNLFKSSGFGLHMTWTLASASFLFV